MDEYKLSPTARLFGWVARRAASPRLRGSISARVSAVITAGVLLAITGAVLAVIAVFGLIFLPVATFPQVDAEILGVVGLVIAVMGGAIAGLGE